MFSTPYYRVCLTTSTPLQTLEDSGYFERSGKLPLELHTLSPIKEISNCQRTPELIELPKFKLSQEFDSVLDSSEVIKELDFSSSDFFDRSLKNLRPIDSFPSFQLRDLSTNSEDGIGGLAQITSSSPLKKGADLKELFWLSLLAGSLPPAPKEKSKLDVLAELQRKNIFSAINRILSLVSAADLCKMSCVSQVWKNIVCKDVDANLRKKKYLLKKSSRKENITRSRVVEESSCKEIYLNSIGALNDKANVEDSSKEPHKKQILSRFDSFLKEGKTSKGSLMKCPKCKYAAKELTKSLCLCTECKHVFCQACLCPYQNGHKCAAPKEVPIVVGSKASKRNLKRL